MIKVIWSNYSKGEIISEAEYNKPESYFRRKYPDAIHVKLYYGENTYVARHKLLF